MQHPTAARSLGEALALAEPAAILCTVERRAVLRRQRRAGSQNMPGLVALASASARPHQALPPREAAAVVVMEPVAPEHEARLG